MPPIDLAEQIVSALPRAATGEPLRDFLVIPNQGVPRWLLPTDGRHSGSVLCNWSPYRLSSRIKWSAIRAANDFGVLGSLPQVSRLQMNQTPAIDWDELGWAGDRPPLPIVYVGTPGPTRKAVIHLVDAASGNCEAVVKVPLALEARQAIVREGNALRALALQQLSCAPRLLQIDEERGLSTQQFLPGKHGSRRFLPAYWEFLQSLMLPDEQTSIVEYAALWQEELPFADIPKADCSLLSSCLAELSDARPLTAFWVHGDFAPWNIKRRGQDSLALLDWEEAQWRGLPLYDAYHFFHMQDFLFGSHPRLHVRDVEAFGGSLGLVSHQTRKLEIAYLSHAYLKGIAQGHVQRREFLVKTLAAALRDRPAVVALPEKPRGKLQLVSSRFVNPPNIRAELFAALMAKLNALEVPYCVLSGYDDDPVDNSDLDIMVGAGDMCRLPALLAQTARAAGASLVQEMSHETTACYFVMAKADGGIGYLDPDCCSHYRRDGRTWLLAEDVLAGRRKYKNFYRPAVADEFIYYLLKKVLKQHLQPHHLKRLQHLYVRNPGQCQEKIARFWDTSTVPLLQRAVVEQDLYWFQTQLPTLLLELRKSPPTESAFRRMTGRLRDVVRLARRVIHPTGLVLSIEGGTEEQRAAIAGRMLRYLVSAFRHTNGVHLDVGWVRVLAIACGAWISRIRSTLVIATGARDSSPGGWRRWLQNTRSMFARVLLQPDMIIALTPQRLQPRDSASGPFLTASAPPNILATLHLDTSVPEEQLVQIAASAVLHRLAARLETRRAKITSCRRATTPNGMEAEPAHLQLVEGD